MLSGRPGSAGRPLGTSMVTTTCKTLQDVTALPASTALLARRMKRRSLTAPGALQCVPPVPSGWLERPSAPVFSNGKEAQLAGNEIATGRGAVNSANACQFRQLPLRVWGNFHALWQSASNLSLNIWQLFAECNCVSFTMMISYLYLPFKMIITGVLMPLGCFFTRFSVYTTIKQ